MIDAVIYDFGGVFIASPFQALQRIGAERGMADGLLTAIVFGSYDEDTDHPWHRAERGELDIIATRDAIAELARTHGHEVDLFTMLGNLGGGGTVSEAMVDCVRRARAAGAKTAMLTNNLAEGRAMWRALLPVDELFDVVVDSSAVGIRKPDPRVFAHTLEALGNIAPERAVFLDDYPGNLRAAEALGIRTILVDEDPIEAIAALDALLTS